ncbi:MAG: hypothetical protein IKC11_02800 [Clostridia bacterium]|nr:hypothetical protein [Clostridia bacterium]
MKKQSAILLFNPYGFVPTEDKTRKKPSAIHHFFTLHSSLFFNPCGLVPAEDKTLFCDSSLFILSGASAVIHHFFILHSSFIKGVCHSG